MSRAYKAIISTVIAILLVAKVNGQCVAFAKESCKSKLETYVHDGNYHAATLSEGEGVELHKTFFEGQDYRLVICKAEKLPNIYFKVINELGRVVYDNSKENYKAIWDFNTSKTQELTVQIMVTEDSEKQVLSGCVAVMFGIKKMTD